LQVVAALGASSSARLAEEVLENIVEDVAESTLSAEIESLRSLRSTGMAEGIVPPPFFLVADDLVGFVQLFEFFFRGFFLFGGCVEIWMVLAGKFPECLLISSSDAVRSMPRVS
jgi:hypothetical protein